MNAPPAHYLDGPLRDVDEIRPERFQGPIPEHLIPTKRAARPEFREIEPELEDDEAAEEAPIVEVPKRVRHDRPRRAMAPKTEQAPRAPESAAAARVPVPETQLQRMRRLRIQYAADHPDGGDRRERETLAKRESEARRRERRAAGDLEKLRPGKQILNPRPPCPDGCAETPKCRGTRRGKVRWHCVRCGRNWTVEIAPKEA